MSEESKFDSSDEVEMIPEDESSTMENSKSHAPEEIIEKDFIDSESADPIDVLLEDQSELEMESAPEKKIIDEDNSLKLSSETLQHQEIMEPLSEEQLLRRIDELRIQIKSYVNELDSTDDSVEQVQEKLERTLAVQEEFSDWVEKRRASYAWKLVERLRGYRERLNSDESTIRAFAAEETKLEFGFAAKTRTWFMKRFMLNFTISWAIVVILYLLHRSAEPTSNWVGQNVSNAGLRKFLLLLIENLVGPGFWNVLAYVFVISLGHFMALLFAYSRRISEYAQHVAEESTRTKAMEDGIHEVRQARERIDSLHPQVPQVLEIFSLGLHNPWHINESALLFTGSVPDASKLPASVEISVPTISKSSPVYEELVYRTMNEIQISGWRSEAFARLIQRLASSLGFGHNEMALRELDEDQRKKGKRQQILEIAMDNEIFDSIGEELVEKLTAITQEKILPTVKPVVASLKPNPLSELELSGSMLKEESEGLSTWEAKLSEIAGFAAPWSRETFSIDGAANKKHEKLESIFLASDRVKGLAAKNIEAHADIRPGSRPFEVSIRVDLSEWCKPNEVAIFEDFQPSAEQLNRWNQKSSDEQSKNTNDITTIVPQGLVL